MAKARGETAAANDRETIKQSKQESDKNARINTIKAALDASNEAKMLVERLLSKRIESLSHLATRLDMCADALDIYERFPSAIEAEKMTGEFNRVFGAKREHFDLKSAEGRTQIEACFGHAENILCKTLIQDEECLIELSKACELIASLRSKNLEAYHVWSIFVYEQHLREISCEAIGYWTAKLEGKKKSKDCGGAFVKNEADQKKEVIKSLLAKYNITSLQVFRKDKDLKKDFLAEAEKETAALDTKHKKALDQNTIKVNARAILKEQGQADPGRSLHPLAQRSSNPVHPGATPGREKANGLDTNPPA